MANSIPVTPLQHLAAGEPAVELGEGFRVTIRSNVELAKERGFVPEIDRFRDALEAVLLFHSGGEWTLEKSTAWRSRVKGDAATGKALCDHIRLLLGGEVQAQAELAEFLADCWNALDAHARYHKEMTASVAAAILRKQQAPGWKDGE